MANVRPHTWIFTAILSVGTTLGCSSDSTRGDSPHSVSGALNGRDVYEKPLSDGNTFSCKTCHALSEPATDGLRRPGHPIGDALHRSHWKQGKVTSFLGAVNSCVTEWMVAPAWREDEPRYLALRDFLESQALPGAAPDLQYTIVAPPTDLTAGDAGRGRTLFNQSCVVCHGMDGNGTERGPKVAGSTRTAEYVGNRIRRSGSATSSVYPGLTGGVMPFWAGDRLDDGEVSDLVAFVTRHEPDQGTAGSGGLAAVGGATALGGTSSTGGMSGATATGAGGASGGRDVGGGGASSGCGTTSPRVGWTADLGINTGEGQVSGFVTAVDDCTLELRDFSYDGNGIDVRVYGSQTTAFKPGFPLGPNIVGRVFKKETLRVSLPPDKKLTDLEWVGIWCVAVGANFGSGPLLPP